MITLLRRIAFGILLSLTIGSAFSQSVDASLLAGLSWRNIGPFRGGRVAAVSGAIGQPGTYYMGLPAGGVWKTTSAGETWIPIFDSIKEASSVGAVEVAPSDPNVVYVGMGDMRTGGCVNEGNGVYKSVDAGKTWMHLGLETSRQIPSILVDPHNPNLVLVAAQGDVREESTTRGVYRSEDGGKTWKRTLFVDKQTGVQKITWAFDHPEVMLATTIRHFSPPSPTRAAGAAAKLPSAINGTKLFISHDQGLTWKEISGHGLPILGGRTSVAVACNTNAKRMFLVSNAGLHRSDDGGASWHQMDGADRRVANGQGGYNCGVYVNPKNPDVVYVVNTCSYRSLDGGATFTGFKGAPGGDDPQQMWLDPTDGNRLFLGTDQGATISLDGGANWSSWYNQPTAQVYRISVDTQWPYWVYATQQDSGCIATASRGNLGAITPMDWLPHPGYEFGAVVADPLNPKISYAGGPDGGIVKTTYPSGQWINVSPDLESGSGLRHAGNQLLAFSETNPHELFAGFQYLMSTTDGGKSWKKLSPDLGKTKAELAAAAKPPAPVLPKPADKPVPPPKPAKPADSKPAIKGQVKVGEVDVEAEMIDPDDFDALAEEQFGPGSGSVESFSSSTVNGNIIWVSTTNGLVWVTQDHGKTWDEVSIPYLPNARRADIASIDASHTDKATAYLAIDFHNSGDYTPWFYRTRDFGHSWRKIVNGLPTDSPSGSFARVIRADTVRDGLVYAGTESSLYVSFNYGDIWQSLAQNAPNTSYRDMVVKGNDLVVGTYGRGFWVLDDVSPLRQMNLKSASEPAHLFKPGTAVRVRRNVNGDTPFPPEVPHALNPPLGAIIYYSLAKAPAGTISVEISDAKGDVIRHMSSDPIPPLKEAEPPVPNFWVEIPKPLPKEIGLSRINWDLRYDAPKAMSHSYEINANPFETPASPEAPIAIPGEYRVTLKADGKTYSQTVTVVNDPRSPASSRDIAAQFKLQTRAYESSQLAFDTFAATTALKDQIAALLNSKPDDAASKALNDFSAKLTTLRGGTGGRRGSGARNAPKPVPSFTRLIGSLQSFMTTLDSGDMAPNETMYRMDMALQEDSKTVMDSWKSLKIKDVPFLNDLLLKHKMPAVKL